jgi:phage terminase small subunit
MEKRIKKAPAGLRAAGKAFWQKVLHQYEIDTAHDFSRLAICCQCLDVIEAAQQDIAENGMYLTDRYGQLRERPSGDIIRKNQTIFLRALRELNLDTVPDENRPPALY